MGHPVVDDGGLACVAVLRLRSHSVVPAPRRPVCVAQQQLVQVFPRIVELCTLLLILLLSLLVLVLAPTASVSRWA